MTQGPKKPLGRILLSQRAISAQDLEHSLANSTGAPLASRLTEAGTITEVAALKALSEQHGVPGIDLGQVCVRVSDLEALPREVALRHKLLPVLMRDDRLFCAMASPSDKKVIDELEFVTGKRVFAYVALEAPLIRAVHAAYDLKDSGGLFYIGNNCPLEVLQKAGVPQPLIDAHETARAQREAVEAAKPKPKPPPPPLPSGVSRPGRPPIRASDPSLPVAVPDRGPPPPRPARSSLARPPLPREEPARDAPEASERRFRPSTPEMRAVRPEERQLVVDDAMEKVTDRDEVDDDFGVDADDADLSVVAQLPMQPDKPKEGQQTILVVDDEADIRRLLRRLFMEKGFHVLEAERGLQALQSVKRQPPDLIVLDAMLPEVHGFDIARRIKGSSRYGHIPIIMISAVYRGWRFAEDAKTSYGVHAYIEKPFKVSDVLKSVQSALTAPSLRGDPESISREAERLLTEGIAAYRAGDLDKATGLLEEGTKLDPLAYRLHFHLGLLYGKRGRLYEAIQELETALQINNKHFPALKNLAVLYQKAGFRNKAIEAWERALAAAPDEATKAGIKEHLLGLL